MAKRVQRLVAEVVANRNPLAGLASRGPVANAGPFTARATWLESGGEDDLDPRRSVWDECGYPATRFVSPQRWQILHDRDAVAATVNEAMVRYAWQVTPEIYERERGKVTTAWEKAWRELGASMRSGGLPDHFGEDEGSPVLEVLERANALSGIARFGAIVYGLDDGLGWDKPVPGIDEQGSVEGEMLVDKDGKPVLDEGGQPAFTVNKSADPRYTLNLATPDNPRLMARTEGRKLGYMNAFPESMVRIASFEVNKRSPRFGMPTAYHVTFQDPRNPVWGTGLPVATERVHWTRVQHVVDTVHTYGSSQVFGVPRCQTVLNNVLALQKLYHGGPEGFWKHCFPYLFLETHPQLGGDVDVDDEALRDMIEEMMNGLQKAGVMTGMTARTVGGAVADPTAQVNLHLEAIAMKKRMPVRILKGSERGELSSAQDDDSWNDQVIHYEKGYVTPGLLRPMVNRLCWYGVLRPPEEPKGLRVFWPDITSMSAEQRSRVAQSRTSAMAQYWQGSVAQGMTWFDYLTRELGYKDEEALRIVSNAMGAEQDTHGEPPIAVPRDDGEVVEMEHTSDALSDDTASSVVESSALNVSSTDEPLDNDRLCWGKPCPEGAAGSGRSNVSSTRAEVHSKRAEASGRPEHHAEAADAHKTAAKEHFDKFLDTGDETALATARWHGKRAEAHRSRSAAVVDTPTRVKPERRDVEETQQRTLVKP